MLLNITCGMVQSCFTETEMHISSRPKVHNAYEHDTGKGDYMEDLQVVRAVNSIIGVFNLLIGRGRKTEREGVIQVLDFQSEFARKKHLQEVPVGVYE